MTAASSDPDAPIVFCSNWTDTVQWVEQFPAPEIAIDYEGDVTGTAWVFRGLKDSRYQLLPTIEREAECTGMPWSALEVLVSSEFKSRAHMHLSNLIAGDEFTWLAQMQHYAIPTRLLDFTHSPFVALYFAIRESRQEKDRASVRVWAIDAGAINSRFRLIASKARSAQREYDGKPTSHRVRLDLDSFATARDSMVDETHGMRTLIAESLAASQAFRGVLNRSGGVCVASPPAFNPRLAGQQGVFLWPNLKISNEVPPSKESCRIASSR
jgi:hypothetical protein